MKQIKSRKTGEWFYSHPRGTALGCPEYYEVQFFTEAANEAQRPRASGGRKYKNFSTPGKCHNPWCDGPKLQGGDYCERCQAIKEGKA
jgi:hypothetical protein